MSAASWGAWVLAQGDNLDPVPEPADVNAGLVGLIIFLGLIAAVAVLVTLMSRQLKRVNRNAEQGAYDDLPDGRRAPRQGRAEGGDDPDGIS